MIFDELYVSQPEKKVLFSELALGLLHYRPMLRCYHADTLY